MTITFKLADFTSTAVPLLHQYPGQLTPQPAYIYLNEDGEVYADWSGEIGSGTPMDVWHGRRLQYRICERVSGDDLATWLQSDDVRALLERILAGHSVEWDGSNHVGRLDEDARDASETFELLAEAYTNDAAQNVWDVADWLFGGHNNLADVWPKHQSLAEAVSEQESSIELGADGPVIGDVAECLLKQAKHDFGNDSDRIGQVHIDALLADGRITQEQATDWAEEQNE